MGLNPDKNLLFLTGGGEMGELTRSKDWSLSELGLPQNWSQSLKTTINILLNSKFPMFLWWGKELFCFYNDAYRVILGENGKHPEILGKPAKEAWQEIWQTLEPLSRQVLDGESILLEDQLIPIFRNGHKENVYWTFGYSPVRDESGIAGVLATCIETTEKMNDVIELRRSHNEMEFAIKATELGTFDYNPITNKFRGNSLTRSWFGLFPDNEQDLDIAIESIKASDRPRVRNAINNALDSNLRLKYDLIYTVVNPDLKDRIVHAKGKASFDENNTAYRLTGTLQDITEKVDAKNYAEEVERSNKLMILQAPVAICILRGPQSIFENVNPLMEKMLGRSVSEVEGKPIFEAMPELMNQGLEDILSRILLSGDSFTAVEQKFELPREGRLEERFITYIYEPIKNNDDAVTGVMVVAIDVSEQVISRKKIEESEQRVRTMVDSAPFPIGVYVGSELRIELANQAMLDTWGKGNQVIGKKYTEILPEFENQKIFNQMQSVLTTGIPYHAKNKCVNIINNGKPQNFFLNYSLVPLNDLEGNVYAILSTAADVTDLNIAKQKVEDAAAELSKTSGRLAIALEAGKLGSYELNLADGSMEATAQYKQNLGLEVSTKMTLQMLIESIIPEDKPIKLDAVELAISSKKTYNIEYRVKWPNGSTHWIRASGIPIFDDAGNAVQITGVTADITEQKIFEIQLEAQVSERTKELGQINIDLEKMNKELQSFAYISSHDLQEPLRKIQTFSSLMLDSEFDNLSDQGKHYFTRMQTAANRMQMLIDDLLAYSRSSKKESKFENTHLSGIVAEIKNDLSEEIELRNAVIEETGDCEIMIIPFQFRQLMQNLISNSMKFSKPGKAPHIIIMSEHGFGNEFENPNLDPEKSYCHISVTDNGIGFPKEFSEKIFELFQRLHSKDQYLGTGIGLAIVKKIVENHNGIITATSQPDHGARFDIYIPTEK